MDCAVRLHRTAGLRAPNGPTLADFTALPVDRASTCRFRRRCPPGLVRSVMNQGEDRWTRRAGRVGLDRGGCCAGMASVTSDSSESSPVGDRLSVNSYAAAWAFDDYRLTPTGSHGAISSRLKCDWTRSPTGKNRDRWCSWLSLPGWKTLRGRRARRAATGGL